MKWLTKILSALPFIPSLVQAIESIHGQAETGATKKQMAMESLGISQAVADAVAPEEKTQIDAAAELASTVIDASVAAFNKAGWSTPTHAAVPAPAIPAAKPAPSPAPAPTPAPATPAVSLATGGPVAHSSDHTIPPQS